MKILTLSLLLLLIFSFSASAQQKENKLKKKEVPVIVATAFENKFLNAKKTKWYKEDKIFLAEFYSDEYKQLAL